MRRIKILLVGVMLIFFLFGCSKITTEPTLNLINGGITNTTILVEYKINGVEKNYGGEFGTSHLKIKQGNKLQYKSSASENKCTLLIESLDTKKKVKEVVLDNNNVDTSVPQGKYIYNFLVEWKDGSAKFIKFIEIE
jgi:hypothetical protein